MQVSDKRNLKQHMDHVCGNYGWMLICKQGFETEMWKTLGTNMPDVLIFYKTKFKCSA